MESKEGENSRIFQDREDSNRGSPEVKAIQPPSALPDFSEDDQWREKKL
jgi:hypothetical protein